MTIRSRHKKARLRHEAETTDPGSASRAATTGGITPDSEFREEGGGALIEDRSDLHMLQRLRQMPDWQVPPRAAESVPRDVLAMAENVELKPSTRIMAYREVRSMVKDNVAKSKSSIELHFSPRIQGVLQPRPPRRPEGEPEPRPLGFIEDVSAEDAIATLEVLRQVNALHHLLDQDLLPESLQGPLSEPPPQIDMENEL